MLAGLGQIRRLGLENVLVVAFAHLIDELVISGHELLACLLRNLRRQHPLAGAGQVARDSRPVALVGIRHLLPSSPSRYPEPSSMPSS